jgi:phage nucleotide-binding protein
MAIQLRSTKDAVKDNGLKVLTYGLAGTGKTTLCATTGAPTVIISAEAGLLSLRGHDIAVIEVASIADVHEAYNYLMTADEAKHFEWVCLDSISEIAEQVLNFEKKNSKDPRQAYGALAEQMQDLIRAFRDMPGKNVYMSCKMERIKDESTGGLLYSPAMPGAKLSQAISYFFDEVFVLRAEKADDGQIYRTLQTQGDYNYVAKDRSGALELYEEPHLGKIAAKITTTSKE